VFIGGYSQGATIALLTALTGGVGVDGLAVVKGWVARSQDIRQVCLVLMDARGWKLMIGIERWVSIHPPVLGSRKGRRCSHSCQFVLSVPVVLLS
jgi:pimeloyl-ACP methyl ester carboxylesterase